MSKSIEELIEASSLGTPEVKALREQTPPEAVEKIMQRVAELGPKPRLTPEREAWLRRRPAHYLVHEVWPELDRLREKLAIAYRQIHETVEIVDPECPDVGAYEDGHCGLAGAVRVTRRALIDILDGMNPSELEHATGLTPERCAEIFDLLRSWRSK